MNATKPERETLQEKIARLRDGRWHPSDRPRQVTAQVPVKIPGGPVVKMTKHVYRASVFRHPADGGRVELDGCFHNHLKQRAAIKCAKREANRRNREETP